MKRFFIACFWILKRSGANRVDPPEHFSSSRSLFEDLVWEYACVVATLVAEGHSWASELNNCSAQQTVHLKGMKNEVMWETGVAELKRM